ncbi:SIR2 family protein [Yonghaparkia sp. Soil809]|uniref:SIR2 family NAD-dependent protein deacylase n=1 Tax=Yonghaparkia sp. Soil809 TaxID=1736417 RepID=UPI0006F93074|nr:SIR2 family protein [Yonghaparkia sp. Soil809]KRF31110.1 hypothetical protein ASG83_09825 [Yonghaparkia sp. Soil809]
MTSNDAPHVFVVHGDLTQLACDAIMIPTDARLRVEEHWHGVVPEHAALAARPELAAFRDQTTYAHALPPHPLHEGDDHAPVRVLTAVPLHGYQSADVLRPRIRAFVEEAARAIAGHREFVIGTGQPRAVPLVAMPLFSSRGGGGSMRRTSIIDMVLDEARIAARANGVDVALVVREDPDAALAQQRRRSAAGDSWSAVEPRLVEVARHLARYALANRIVPFMGAGVSMSAGAPGWRELLGKLADAIDLDAGTCDALLHGKLGELDQATYLERRYADTERDFRGEVSRLVERPRYGLAPALLAATADEQAITLNYDTLFERASTAARRPRRVLAGGSRGDLTSPADTVSERWLLKLHGSADEPSTIVLTRDDYLGFAADRSALSAIVKANLLTRHLLFVGFGLADDHFHEILHDVKRAVGTSSTAATALTLFDDPLNAALWGDSLTIVPMLTEPASPDALPRAARTLELFLDALAAYSVDSESYLLRDEYADGLSDSELAVRDLLRELMRTTGHSYERKR